MLMAASPGLLTVPEGLPTVPDSEDDIFPPLCAYFGANKVGQGLSSGIVSTFIPGLTGVVLGLQKWLYGGVLGCSGSVLGVLLGVFW